MQHLHTEPILFQHIAYHRRQQAFFLRILARILQKAMKVQKEENNQIGQLTQQLEEAQQQLQQMQGELQKSQQKVQQLDENRLKLEQEKIQLD